MKNQKISILYKNNWKITKLKMITMFRILNKNMKIITKI